MIRHKKLLTISAAVFVVVAVIAAVVWSNATAWERDLTVKYVDYVSAKYDGDSAYYLYEITNNTNRTLRNVYAEIEVFSGGNWKWTFDDMIDGTIRVGETREYKLFWNDVQKSADERGDKLIMATVDIKRIKYE